VNCFAAVLPHEPIITGPPRNATVEVGQTVVFECNVVSGPQPYIQWLKHYRVNGSYVDDKDPYVDVIYVRCFIVV